MTKELERFEEGLKAEILIDLLRMALKNIKLENARSWWNTWILVQEIHHRSWQTSTRNEQEAHIPEWMTQRKTSLIQKDPRKETVPNNCRHITYLPMMWKILTAQIREEIYFSLTSHGLFPEEQKGCRKGSIRAGEMLYIDQHIFNESKTRRKNVAMAWIDTKKTYDMVPQSWITHCLKIYKISDDVINFIEKTMKTWRVELTAGGKT